MFRAILWEVREDRLAVDRCGTAMYRGREKSLPPPTGIRILLAKVVGTPASGTEKPTSECLTQPLGCLQRRAVKLWRGDEGLTEPDSQNRGGVTAFLSSEDFLELLTGLDPSKPFDLATGVECRCRVSEFARTIYYLDPSADVVAVNRRKARAPFDDLLHT